MHLCCDKRVKNLQELIIRATSKCLNNRDILLLQEMVKVVNSGETEQHSAQTVYPPDFE